MNTNPGIIGRKLGMTQLFSDDGNVVRCTIIETALRILDKRTKDKHGYDAVVVGLDERKAKHTSKPLAGQFKKVGQEPRRFVRELRMSADEVAKLEVGTDMNLDQVFEVGQFVDVQGRTRGRGFTGVVRRWSFAGAVTTHGTHEYTRHGGSIGTNMTPGRTMPGKKMPGHYGDETVSMLNLKVEKIIADKGLLLVEGGVPGARNAVVTVRGSVKKKNGGRPKKK